MSDSVRPHRRQPTTRLPRPWDSPGKNTGVGCCFLLQCMKVKSESEVPQSCLTLSDPMDCSPPGSSIHGIFQARVPEWGAITFSEIPGVTGKFGLGVQNEAGQRLIEFCQENALVKVNREDSTHGHHQMVNTEIRLIIFFAAKYGEALYSQQKQDQELTVAPTMNSLLPNSDLN